MPQAQERAHPREEQQDPQEVIGACNAAVEDFEEHGYPDSWHTWNIAREASTWPPSRGAWICPTGQVGHDREIVVNFDGYDTGRQSVRGNVAGSLKAIDPARRASRVASAR